MPIVAWFPASVADLASATLILITSSRSGRRAPCGHFCSSVSLDPSRGIMREASDVAGIFSLFPGRAHSGIVSPIAARVFPFPPFLFCPYPSKKLGTPIPPPSLRGWGFPGLRGHRTLAFDFPCEAPPSNTDLQVLNSPLGHEGDVLRAKARKGLAPSGDSRRRQWFFLPLGHDFFRLPSSGGSSF